MSSNWLPQICHLIQCMAEKFTGASAHAMAQQGRRCESHHPPKSFTSYSWPVASPSTETKKKKREKEEGKRKRKKREEGTHREAIATNSTNQPTNQPFCCFNRSATNLSGWSGAQLPHRHFMPEPVSPANLMRINFQTGSDRSP